MYTLKIVDEENESKSFYALGEEFHIKNPQVGEKLIPDHAVTVTGKAGNNVAVTRSVDAYIINQDGKTIEVVNRASWHEGKMGGVGTGMSLHIGGNRGSR